jgi:stage II sporulation protein D
VLLGLGILVATFLWAPRDGTAANSPVRTKSAPPLSAQIQEQPVPTPEQASYADGTVTVRVKDGDTVRAMTLEEYLPGVVAAEMPADFEGEALRAQAVAARTYTLYRMTVSPSGNHP